MQLHWIQLWVCLIGLLLKETCTGELRVYVCVYVLNVRKQTHITHLGTYVNWTTRDIHCIVCACVFVGNCLYVFLFTRLV